MEFSRSTRVFKDKNVGEFLYHKGKKFLLFLVSFFLNVPVFEKFKPSCHNFSIYGILTALRSVRPILVKVVLFQLSGRGHPLDDATPSFFLNSKSPILGLSNDISFVIFFPLEGG